MKTKLLLSIISSAFFLVCQSQQSSWIPQNSPSTDNFQSVYFIDQDNGWIVSEQGALIFTKDGGNSWQLKNLSGILESVFFSNNNHGCIVGRTITPSDSSLILISEDGGENWSEVDHFKINRLNDVYFINDDIGWAVGSIDEWNLNSCLYTIDGGNTWIIQESLSVVDGELFAVSFRDENLGSTCGNDGAFFITNNGGTQSWAMGVSMPIVKLNDIFNFGILNGCIVGDEGTILYTINNWYQYIEQNSNTSEDLNGVSGETVTNKLWVVGDNGTILYSPNYLLGWTYQNSGVTENLNSICMLNEIEGWAVGDNGSLLHYSPYISISNSNEPQIDIFPNPSSRRLIIQNDNPSSFYKIQIHDSNGKMVFGGNLLHDSPLIIDVTGYESGLYFLTISNNTMNLVKKIIVK
ncbi:MAG: YCF48-related protein [Bacteroidales bacterium]